MSKLKIYHSQHATENIKTSNPTYRKQHIKSGTANEDGGVCNINLMKKRYKKPNICFC